MNQEILNLYFNDGKKQIEIAKILNISKYKVSRTLNGDIRYTNEKNKRKLLNIQIHNKDIQRRVEEKRKKIQFKNKIDDLILKNIHNQDAKELSKGRKLSDLAYKNWNISAYKYNSEKDRFEFREELGRSYDVKKYLRGNM